MTGGLLYTAILAMWAVVLVPMWWRRQEQAHPTRSIDQFNGLMRSLAGERGAVTPSLGRLTPVERRRRVFAVLTLGLLLTTIAVVVGAPAGLLLVPLSLLGGFVFAARGQVQRERVARAAARRRAAADQVTPQGEVLPTPRTETARQAAPEVTVIPVAGPLPAAVEPDRAVEPAVRGVRFDEGTPTWSATPTMLPSYVTAPAATRVPRVIDLKTPGAWSAQAMLREVEQQRSEDLKALVEQATAPAPAPQTFYERYVEDTAPVAVVEHDDRLENILRRVANE